MRQTVAKALRREAVKRGLTTNGYRRVKRKYMNLQPFKEEDREDPSRLGVIIKGKWVTVKTQKKALCLN